jgi:hypothetical protein
MQKKIRVFIVTISAVLTMLAIVSCETNRGSFLLINKANEPITRALVTICRQTIALQDIQPTKSRQGFYEVTVDSHFDIVVEFQSGKKLQGAMGYVTTGYDYEYEIAVSEAGIEIVSSKATPNSRIHSILKY